MGGPPSPPVFTIEKSKPAGMDQEDFPPKLGAAVQTGIIPESSAPHSPSISIATLPDLTTTGLSDEESVAFANPTTMAPHETFYQKVFHYGWRSGHAKLRKKAWEKLPGVFGLS